MSYLWLLPLFFGALAIGLALENAWADSPRLRRWQIFAWTAAIISFLAIDQDVMTRIVGPGQRYVQELITDGCCEGLFPPKDQEEPAQPTDKQTSKKITDRITTPTAQKRNVLAERLSSATRSGQTYRFSAFYPRRKFLPGYDEWAFFYPSLARAFDAIEVADFIAARAAIQETRALLSGNDKHALQGYLSHLHTMVMLELGDTRSVLLNFPPARKELEVAGASEVALLRLDLDHAVAQLAYGLRTTTLDPSIGTKLRANADGNLQELAQYYFFLAMQHASVGEVTSANLMFNNALSYARRLETTDKVAGNRVVALLGEEHSPFVRDTTNAGPIVTPGSQRPASNDGILHPPEPSNALRQIAGEADGKPARHVLIYPGNYFDPVSPQWTRVQQLQLQSVQQQLANKNW
jgi:hypothetical protein